MTRDITIGSIKIGGDNAIVLIAGPCVIESAQSAYRHARALKSIASRAGIPFIYKSSYDKANRTSIKSYRGPGLKKGLAILRKIREELNCPVLSDVHSIEEISRAAKVLDIIQIPAFLSRQTDLVVEAAKTGKVVNIKKGQFLAPWDMKHIIKKIESTGNKKIIVTERGHSFGYNNLVSDFRSLLIMKEFGYPVVYDASHSVQMPGGFGDKSGGESKFIPFLSMAAAACGADGIFVETHEDPDRALSDGPNMIKLSELEEMVLKIKKVSQAVR
ncbi:MAG: 3-deoxy-8-phosphooctulonate synthase [Candidatus Omnitrophota bacterium]|nr:3-deoxy-8-phosphooctulonate synthase [Candidatus Omnitrophota bacterium]